MHLLYLGSLEVGRALRLVAVKVRRHRLAGGAAVLRILGNESFVILSTPGFPGHTLGIPAATPPIFTAASCRALWPRRLTKALSHCIITVRYKIICLKLVLLMHNARRIVWKGIFLVRRNWRQPGEELRGMRRNLATPNAPHTHTSRRHPSPGPTSIQKAAFLPNSKRLG